MALTASTGYAQALNGREAGLQATHQALNRLGSGTPGFAFVIASHQYQARDVVSGVSSLLGDTPMIGFSSPVCLDGVAGGARRATRDQARPADTAGPARNNRTWWSI